MILHYISDKRTHRIRVRRVDAATLAEEAAAAGAIKVRHGGGVANTYGYPAETEAVLAVPVPLGGQLHVAIYATQLPANKVTYGGAAGTCLPCAGPIYDRRYSTERREQAREMTIRQAAADVGRALDPQATAKPVEAQEHAR